MDSMRDERKIQFYRCLPGKLVLIAIFALFFELVLGPFFIPSVLSCSNTRSNDSGLPINWRFSPPRELTNQNET
jgi:hypothetical protein